MGNTNQESSGEMKNEKNSDDNVMVKKLEQQLQLIKANPVFTIFSQFIKKMEERVQLFKVNHVFPILSKFVNLPTRQTVHPPLKLQAEKKETNSLVLWQVYAVGGYFILKWAWAKWNEQRTKKKSSDDSS